MNAPAALQNALRNTFYSLRNRNYRLFFIGQTTSNTGNWLTNLAITLLILQRTNSGVAVGFLIACQYGPILLLSAWAGALADRSDKRRMLFVTQSLEMAQSVGLAIFAFIPHSPLPVFYILAACGGTLLAFDNPLRRSFVGEMVPREDIPNAVVLYSTSVNVSRIFGPALAGLLVATVGFGWCFTVDAVSYVAVILCLAMMRPDELFRGQPKPRERGEVRQALRYLFSIPVLCIPFIMLAIIGTLSYNFNVTLPLFVTRSLHGSGAAFTMLYSVYSFGALVSGLVVAQRRLVDIRHVNVGAAMLGLSMLLLAAVSNITLAIPTIFLVGVASILYMTSSTSLLQMEAKPEMHGRVLALQSVLMIGTAPIGGPALGWLADSAGARAPLILGGIAALGAATFGSIQNRRSQS